MSQIFRFLLREPLLQFLLFGALIFALYQWRAQSEQDNPEQILVSSQRIQQLTSAFERTWQRPPSQVELQALVNDFILEEAFYREARAMGLDHEDTIIRRRLRQKLEFLNADVVQLLEPSDIELTQFIDNHPGRYSNPAQVSFEQILFHGEQGYERSLAALSQAEPSGDRTQLPSQLELASSLNIDRRFGSGFSDKLIGLEPGPWSGPVQSGYGWHLVRVGQVIPAQLPPLEEIKPKVMRDWRYQQGQKLQLQLGQQLLAKYQVEINWPGSAKPGTQ